MSPWQFSLRHLLVAVTFVAIGCTALLNANGWWHAGIWTAAVALLTLAVLLVIFLRGQRQSFWIGFALVGWLAVIGAMANLPPLATVGQAPNQLTFWLYERLPENNRAQFINEQTGQPQMDVPYYPQSPQTTYRPPAQPGMRQLALAVAQQQYMTYAQNPRYIRPDEFLEIGQGLWTLLAAYAGGLVAQWIYRREHRVTAPAR